MSKIYNLNSLMAEFSNQVFTSSNGKAVLTALINKHSTYKNLNFTKALNKNTAIAILEYWKSMIYVAQSKPAHTNIATTKNTQVITKNQIISLCKENYGNGSSVTHKIYASSFVAKAEIAGQGCRPYIVITQATGGSYTNFTCTLVGGGGGGGGAFGCYGHKNFEPSFSRKAAQDGGSTTLVIKSTSYSVSGGAGAPAETFNADADTDNKKYSKNGPAGSKGSSKVFAVGVYDGDYFYLTAKGCGGTGSGGMIAVSNSKGTPSITHTYFQNSIRDSNVDGYIGAGGGGRCGGASVGSNTGYTTRNPSNLTSSAYYGSDKAMNYYVKSVTYRSSSTGSDILHLAGGGSTYFAGSAYENGQELGSGGHGGYCNYFNETTSGNLYWIIDGGNAGTNGGMSSGKFDGAVWLLYKA